MTSLETTALPKEVWPKEVWIGWISSLAEAYNMSIFSFLAPLLAPFLFPDAASWSAIFFSYSLVFLGSCFLYPLGAIYYGLLGDQKGRQKLCIYSTLGLAIATGMMGLAPLSFLNNYGWLYFLILISAQHFFSGGEYHGSIVFSLEHSDQQQSGLMSACSCLFAVFGLAAANGLATLSFFLPNELGMRLCFFAGAAGGLLSYFLKNYCQETPAFISIVPGSQEVTWLNFVKLNVQKIATLVAVLAFFLVSYTFIFIFLPLLYLESQQTFDTFKSLIAYGIFLILAGWLADRLGLQKIMLLGIFLFSAAILPLCYFCKNLFVLQMILTPCACLAIGPIHGWMLQQFTPEYRCRGLFISSALATSLFGGSTVPLCLMLFEKTQSLALCSLYPCAIALSAYGVLRLTIKPS